MDDTDYDDDEFNHNFIYENLKEIENLSSEKYYDNLVTRLNSILSFDKSNGNIMKNQQHSYSILDNIKYEYIIPEQLEHIASLISPIITINFHILPDNPTVKDEPLTIFYLFETKFKHEKLEKSDIEKITKSHIQYFLKYADIKDLFIINYENIKFTTKILLYYISYFPLF
jgi:hypothetical protein